jgi:DNA polymerase-4
MDAFYASVEVLDDPSLRGKPVLVGHDGSRGVVSAASYEARTFGCHSAQPMAVARRLCPHAIVCPVRFDRYRELSRMVFDIFDRFSPAVEPLSVDEAFVDLTGTERLLGPDAVAIGRNLKRQIRDETGLTASVGVAPNKFLAKLASDMDKPDGLTVITPATLDAILLPLPVERMWGVGPATAARLRAMNIRTFADLRRTDGTALGARFGTHEAERYRRLAFGLDDRPVHTDRQAKSIGHERTFGVDVQDADVLRSVLLGQAEDVSARLRRRGLRARTVTVKIRSGDFHTVTRRSTLPKPADTTAPLWDAARSLFDTWAAAGFRPVRLIGVAAADLATPADQMDLFADPAAARHGLLDAAVDRINARFGKGAVRRVGTSKRPQNDDVD